MVLTLLQVRGQVQADNLDALNTQELWTSGQIYAMVFKEKMWNSLSFSAKQVCKGKRGLLSFCLIPEQAGVVLTKLAGEHDLSRQPEVFFKQKITSAGFFMNSIGAAVSSFVATGNFQAKFCSDLQQESGFVILAEKLNHLRYTAHFRCVHRGAYFQEMKTTTVRKLMPESWGFLCPVHTPDGAPCGLLNHLAADCLVDPGRFFCAVSSCLCFPLLFCFARWDVHAHFEPLLALLESLGLVRASRPAVRSKRALPVLLDGKGWSFFFNCRFSLLLKLAFFSVAGELPDELLPGLVARLRSLKRSGEHPHVSPFLEVVSVPRGGESDLFVCVVGSLHSARQERSTPVCGWCRGPGAPCAPCARCWTAASNTLAPPNRSASDVWCFLCGLK